MSQLYDENAFGVLISYYAVEDDEYSLERDQFVERLGAFHGAVLECLENLELGSDVKAVNLGHAMYVELADGDQSEDPIAWAKAVRARLTGRQFETAVVVSHGGRWVSEDGAPPADAGEVVWVAYASEPLRRALYADTATRPDEEADTPGWGPGVYVDTEVVEALGRKLKNAPTPLSSAGATFFRVAR